MKKVLSLLLVCVMLLSFALVANAAGEGYTLTAGKYFSGEDPDSGEMVTTWDENVFAEMQVGSGRTSQIITLKVETKTAAAAGAFALAYDSTKVEPVRYNGTYTKVFNTFSDSTYMNFKIDADATVVTVQNGSTMTYPDTALKACLVTWQGATGTVPAGTGICYVNFACLENVTTEDFDADTFKFSTDSSVLTKYELEFGGKIVNAEDAVCNVTSTSTFTYPNSTVGGSTGGGEGEDADYSADVEAVPSWETGFKYDTDKTAAESTSSEDVGRKVVTFGKNASGDVLAAGEYGVQIGNRTYAGRMAVPANAYFAIIVVNSASDAAIATAYKYRVWTGNEDAPTFQTEELNALVD